MELVDIGCNLAHDAFDDDRAQVIERAHAAGVAQMIVTGASAEGSRKALEVARQHPGVLFATAGIHPHHASDFNEAVADLVSRLIEHEEVLAVGETGLDYFRDFSPRPAQRAAFERHIEIAAESAMPMFLHMRDAHDDFFAMVRQARDRLGPVVVHCFTGEQTQLHDYLDIDCHIGITGWICDERRGTHMRSFLGDIPENRLMVETDAPYLKPRDLRPRVKTHRNEPQWLPWIVQAVAASRGVSADIVAEQTTRTARAFFGIEIS